MPIAHTEDKLRFRYIKRLAWGYRLNGGSGFSSLGLTDFKAHSFSSTPDCLPFNYGFLEVKSPNPWTWSPGTTLGGVLLTPPSTRSSPPDWRGEYRLGPLKDLAKVTQELGLPVWAMGWDWTSWKGNDMDQLEQLLKAHPVANGTVLSSFSWLIGSILMLLWTLREPTYTFKNLGNPWPPYLGKPEETIFPGLSGEGESNESSLCYVSSLNPFYRHAVFCPCHQNC